MASGWHRCDWFSIHRDPKHHNTNPIRQAMTRDMQKLWSYHVKYFYGIAELVEIFFRVVGGGLQRVGGGELQRIGRTYNGNELGRGRLNGNDLEEGGIASSVPTVLCPKRLLYSPHRWPCRKTWCIIKSWR